MYWQEETDREHYTVPEDVVDLLFAIACPTLPVDHAWALSAQIRERLPWFADEARAGLHLIHGADSGNGWARPEGADDLLHLSRRTRLTLRIPRARIDETSRLCGEELDVAGHRMKIGAAKVRRLSLTNILYARYVAAPEERGEDAFIEWAVAELKGRGLRFKKILCGRETEIGTPDGPLKTRSLMVGNLPVEDAVLIQEEGIGVHRALGCGLFIPQKSF